MKNHFLSVLTVIVLVMVGYSQHPAAEASPATQEVKPHDEATPTDDNCVWEECDVPDDCHWNRGVWACMCCYGNPHDRPLVHRRVCRPTRGAAPAC